MNGGRTVDNRREVVDNFDPLEQAFQSVSGTLRHPAAVGDSGRGVGSGARSKHAGAPERLHPRKRDPLPPLTERALWRAYGLDE